MTDPRVVGKFGKGFVAATLVGAVALSTYFQNAMFLVYWLYGIALFAIACLVIAIVWSITIWPLLLLISRFFNGPRQ